MSHIYKVSDDIYGDRSYFKDEWDDYMVNQIQSKRHEGYYESRLEKMQREFEEEQEENQI